MEIERADKNPSIERVLAFLSRVAVWGLFFGLLFVLRSFFLLIFLTFIFSYIQSHGVERLQHYIRRRSLAVSMTGISILLVLVAIGWFLIPQVIDQARIVADRHASYLQRLDREFVELFEQLPVLESLVSEAEINSLRSSLDESTGQYDSSRSVSLRVLQQLAGFESETKAEANIGHLVELTRNIGQPLLAIGSAFFLSLLFSFLIILDLPRLTESVKGLADSRLGFVYEEVAPSIKSFATVLGRAFQAQLLIALLNTSLTAVIIYVLGLQKSIAFLSLIVFFCGFIPVAGVFISSVPICLMALQQSGLKGVLLGIVLIWLVHMIEAYILNPRIFGDKLKINPVIVLIILTIAGKLFGVWGLLLSLPVYTYVFGYAIRKETVQPDEGVVDDLQNAAPV